MKKVLAFGTFDGLHPGHHAFLKQARSLGDHLTVVVARDQTVNELKGRSPKIEFRRRCESLRQEAEVDEVMGSDLEVGSWETVKKVKPDVIAIGHDQTLLRESLESFLHGLSTKPEIRMMAFHPPEDPR